MSDFVDSIDTGSELSFKQIYEIILEGDYRYRHQIPPGYEDTKGKEGIQKFGDLIITPLEYLQMCSLSQFLLDQHLIESNSAYNQSLDSVP